MSLLITLALMALDAALFAFAARRGGRPSDPLRPRMVPWTPVAILAGVVFILLLAHLFALMGLEPQNRLSRF
jgi:hypothetical protein